LPNISLGSTATRTNTTISYDKAPSSNGENEFIRSRNIIKREYVKHCNISEQTT